MLDENTQFLLSQYSDASLPEADRPAVEALLRESAEARRALAEYRRLATLMAAGTASLPETDWDALAKKISRHVDAHAAPPTASIAAAAEAQRAWFAAPRTWLMAASLLLAGGLVWLVSIWQQPAVTGGGTVASVAEVRVLQGEEMQGAALAEVSIGPAPEAQAAAIWELHPDLLTDQPASIAIAGGPQMALRDDLFSLYQ